MADEQLWPVPSLGRRTAVPTPPPRRCSSSAPAAVCTGHLADRDRRRRRGCGDLPPSRRHPVGDRTGRVPDGVDDRGRGARSPRRPIPAAGRIAARAGTPPDPAARGAVVLRPARRHRKVLAGKVFGVRRRIRPGRPRVRSPTRDDEFATLDLLDALVRKSLLVADRSSGRTRFSMLETIRQFAEEQLAASGEPTRPAPRTPATSRAAKPTCSRCGTVRASARHTRGSTLELANLRAASAGPPTTATSTPPPPSPSTRPFLGYWLEQHEPIAWAEELIEPAKAVEHRRLAQLYVMAAQCYFHRAHRGLPRLCRSRPGSHRQADVSTMSVTSSRPGSPVATTVGGPARAVHRLVPQHDRRERARAPSYPGMPGPRHLCMAGDRDEAMSQLLKTCSLSPTTTDNPDVRRPGCSSRTAWPTATPIPSPRTKPSVEAWRSLMTAETDRSSRPSRSACRGSPPPTAIRTMPSTT